MLSAIVCAFEADDETINKILRSYRTMTVGRAMLGEHDPGDVISITRYGPGPRRSAI